ncbi:MAG: hypothetical protein DRH03_05000 [Deltaproteobacteria bacterium]|nr:MAG: hypothetical protein DRH03_05000 [Deltaproteobacteria bacterium]
MQSIETIVSDSKRGYTLQGTVITLDNDDVVVVLGGGRDHIGAIGLAVPRPSLLDQNSISATTSVLTMPGHKDDEPAKYVSEKLAAATERNIAVITGIHYDNLAFTDLEILQKLWISLTEKIIVFINQK